ncbi:MAG: sugar phosphate isomerase/epimerase family protein [bacterium]
MDIYITSKISSDFEKVIKIAEENHINIEISDLLKSGFDEKTLNKTISIYSEKLKNFNGKISIHGCCGDLSTVSKDPEIKKISIQRYQMSFDTAKALGATTIVFHSNFVPFGRSKEHYIKKLITKNIEFWKEFIVQFESAKITAVIENVYDPSPEVINKIVEGVNSPYLKACLDTGHANIISQISPYEWLNEYKNNIHHIHAHNNHKAYDQHNGFFDGSINFEEFFKGIQSLKINPNIVIEVFDKQQAISSVKFLQEFLKKGE